MPIFKRYLPLVENWEGFQQALTQPLPTCLWANPLKISPKKVAEILAADGVQIEPLPWFSGGFKVTTPGFKPGRHWAYLAGLYHVQEAVSMLPVLLLKPQPGERVLDMCAAPGNKTVQIGVQMKNRGTVVANDLNFGRMRAARQSLERLGLLNVCTTVANGTNYPNAAGQFNRVLVDAPCSCEGTSRKTPAVVQRTGVDVSRKKSGLQRALLRKAVHLCKAGGRIVYATCTYAPEENEMVVDAILKESGPELRLIPARLPGFTASTGLTAWEGQPLDAALQHTMRIWPHQNDTGGFFVAVLEKSSGPTPDNQFADVSKLPPVPDELLQIPAERFGILPDTFAPNILFRQSRNRVHLLNAGHRPPLLPQPDALGMSFLNLKPKFPKLSTAAALHLGQAATKNFIEVDALQRDAYLHRQSFQISAEQARHCTGIGYILVRYLGFALGVALYRPQQNGEGGEVASLYPKGWSPAG